MNKPKHTPEPWKSYINGDETIIAIDGKRNDGYQINICNVYVGHHEQELLSNARLIAAAPDLLKGSHAALVLLRDSGFTDKTKAIVLLKTAIAKAEGEEK